MKQPPQGGLALGLGEPRAVAGLLGGAKLEPQPRITWELRGS